MFQRQVQEGVAQSLFIPVTALFCLLAFLITLVILLVVQEGVAQSLFIPVTALFCLLPLLVTLVINISISVKLVSIKKKLKC